MTKVKKVQETKVVEHAPTVLNYDSILEVLNGGVEYDTFNFAYQKLTANERKDLPAISIKDSICSIRKATKGTGYKTTEFHNQITDLLESENRFMSMLEISASVGREPYPVRGTIKQLKNENRPDELRVKPYIKVDGGKVSYLYTLASKFQKLMLQAEGVTNY